MVFVLPGSRGAVQLALENRNLRGSGVAFVTAPVAGLGREGEQSVVYLDERRSAQLWGAVRNGSVAQYADLNPTEALSATPS